MYDMQSSTVMAILTFVPQWSVIIAAGLTFHYDVFFAIVLQTWAFVAFNKVMTAQYFLWYMSLMPFIAINNGIIHKKPAVGFILYLSQIAYMVFWGFHAFQLEFAGVNYFTRIDLINKGFFVINLISMVFVSKHHQLTITHEIDNKIKSQ
jgi:phosphatidylinositol glycan class M